MFIGQLKGDAIKTHLIELPHLDEHLDPRAFVSRPSAFLLGPLNLVPKLILGLAPTARLPRADPVVRSPEPPHRDVPSAAPRRDGQRVPRRRGDGGDVALLHRQRAAAVPLFERDVVPIRALARRRVSVRHRRRRRLDEGAEARDAAPRGRLTARGLLRVRRGEFSQRRLRVVPYE
eukprot:31399-Pelagococcus_subviridis.AAC.1